MSAPTEENPKPRNKGGFSTHKPGCKCYPCTARRRKEEAESGGDGTEALEKAKVLNADDPEVLITDDRSPRGRVATWIAHRTANPDLTNLEIAEKMGISRSHLQFLIARASKEGWLKFENPLDRFEYELTPLAVKNLKKFLKEEDKTATFEYARGVLFPQYKDSRGIHESKTTVLALKIEYPRKEGEVVEGQKVYQKGKIVGTPNVFIEGEVSESK